MIGIERFESSTSQRKQRTVMKGGYVDGAEGEATPLFTPPDEWSCDLYESSLRLSLCSSNELKEDLSRRGSPFHTFATQ